MWYIYFPCSYKVLTLLTDDANHVTSLTLSSLLNISPPHGVRVIIKTFGGNTVQLRTPFSYSGALCFQNQSFRKPWLSLAILDHLFFLPSLCGAGLCPFVRQPSDPASLQLALEPLSLSYGTSSQSSIHISMLMLPIRW